MEYEHTVNNDGIRCDDLGHETQFILCNRDLPHGCTKAFEALLYNMAQGFTLLYGEGGWRGAVEPINIYRVASLTDEQRAILICWLLDNTRMTDVYVILPGGMAKGYSRTTEPATEQPALYNTAPAFSGKLHGVRDTGWPHTAADHP